MTDDEIEHDAEARVPLDTERRIMTPEQLYNDAIAAKKQGAHVGMSLVFQRGQKRPDGFPRGELLCETERGLIYSVSPDKVIAWLKKNGLIAA